MAMHHALSGELISIRPLGTAIAKSVTAALYKTQHVEVFRVVLLAGKELPEHQVDGEMTVQCLEGSVEFSIGTTRDVMRSGDLKCLAGGTPHSLRSLQDASLLVTLLLHGTPDRPPVLADFTSRTEASESVRRTLPKEVS